MTASCITNDKIRESANDREVFASHFVLETYLGRDTILMIVCNADQRILKLKDAGKGRFVEGQRKVHGRCMEGAWRVYFRNVQAIKEQKEGEEQ